MGSRRRELVNAEAGVYRYDQLVVLRATRMPPVLFEAGSIINREEELLMSSPERHATIGDSIVDAVDRFCALRRPLDRTARRPGAMTPGKQTFAPAAASQPPNATKSR
jgi:hypothetical protein